MRVSWICVQVQLMILHSRHLLPRILNLSNTRAGILPEGEEFLLMLYAFDVLDG